MYYLHFLLEFSKQTLNSPEGSLALQKVLEAQQAFFPLRPVGTGAVVQDLGYVLRLTHVVWHSSVP